MQKKITIILAAILIVGIGSAYATVSLTVQGSGNDIIDLLNSAGTNVAWFDSNGNLHFVSGLGIISNGKNILLPTSSTTLPGINITNNWFANQNFASGTLVLENPTKTFAGSFVSPALSGNVTWTMPSSSGTLVTTSSIKELTSPVPDFQTGFFSTSGWTQTGLNETITASRLQWNATMSTSATAEVYDLGKAAQDNAWTIRFLYHVNTFSGNTNARFIFIGLSSTSSGDSNVNENFIGAFARSDTGSNYLSGTWTNNEKVDNNAHAVTGGSAQTVGTNYYVQLERTSATNATLSVYSDAGFSQLVYTINLPVTSGIQGLRYFKVMGDDYSTNVNLGILNGYIDDLQFFDNVNL